MPGQKLLVRCKVSAGLFSTEFYISVLNTSAYVDRSQVRVSRPPEGPDEVDGLVQAYMVESGPEEALIELPGQPVVGGLRTWVPNRQLQPA